MTDTMKEAIVRKGPKVEIVDSKVPTPNDDQVVIKTVYSGSNPKDWKLPYWVEGQENNQGDDIAGYVHEVGSNVTEFKKGDRVAAFHEMTKPGGSYAEYSVAWAHTTFHLPKNVSFEEGATVPLAAMTSAIGLFGQNRLDLPSPLRPATEPIPLVVYGGASAVGAYVIQLAKRANIHPLIVVAGRGKDFVEKLIEPEKGDVYIDYRKGDDAIVEGIKAALHGAKLNYAYDAVSEKGSYQNIIKVLEPTGKITLVLPGRDFSEIPESVQKSVTTVGAVHDDYKDFGYVYFRLLARGLQDGWFKPHPHQVVPGGLAGVEEALDNLKEGRASAVKYVFKLADTPGAKKYSASTSEGTKDV